MTEDEAKVPGGMRCKLPDGKVIYTSPRDPLYSMKVFAAEAFWNEDHWEPMVFGE